MQEASGYEDAPGTERMIDEMDSHLHGNDEEEKLRASRV
jgi:hypothetical protein